MSDSHISKTNPQVTKAYGKSLWLDPGEPEAVDHSLSVILDVVQRYDIDGVHLDDYFYPYPIKDDERGKRIAFPDNPSWEKAVAEGTTLSRDDWRRQNVDRFIERLYREIKRAKRGVKFGVSPFGIWRPGNPPQIKGFDQYATIYADARKWFVEGWLDYFTPQLYWKLGPPAQSYPALLHWWNDQNQQPAAPLARQFHLQVAARRGERPLDGPRRSWHRFGRPGPNRGPRATCISASKRWLATQTASPMPSRPGLTASLPWYRQAPG